MATYIHGSSEIQAADSAAGGLQTLYLMTPNNNSNYLNVTGYSETHNHALHHTQSQPHHQYQYIHNNNSRLLLGAVNPALPVVVGPEDLNRSFSSSSLSSLFHYNSTIWGPAATNGTHQGLSLTLSYREQAAGSMARPAAVITTNGDGAKGDSSADIVMGSKYLKAAQQLLDEVVKVAEGGSGGGGEQIERSNHTINAGRVEEGSGGGENTGKQRGHELTTAQKQELQMKKAKLVNMLDEVEQRYKQYHNQMQIVVSSFEQAAGIGSSKSYTALALQTISKQFRCLKDAITIQIKAAAGGLGDRDCNDYGSRLKFVDRQQRAALLHPQHHHNINAWRPQRGLPETAVSVLRAWLFEHFLHPYPKDSDKHMLAKQTGLTRSQVSNWFINARVRLWKPMVEEMYLEEMKQHDQEFSPKHTNNESLASPQSKSISPNHQAHSMQIKGCIDSPRTQKRSKLSENNNNINDVGSFGAYINPLIGTHNQLVGGGFHDFLSNQMVQTSHYDGGVGGDGGIMGGASPPLHSGIINNNGYDHINNNSRKRFVAWGQ